MNYWPAEVTNLPETHQPLFQMLKELSESGKGTAMNMYGADGWVAHHNTDIWRVTSPIDFAAAGMGRQAAESAFMGTLFYSR